MAIKLTKDYDVVTGTDGNDSFIAKVLGNSNTFQSGDEINGGAGTDTLNIVLGNESGFAISAETTSVEKVSVRSQSNNGGDASAEGNSGDNNVSSYESADGDADENTIDAQDMVGVKEFWNTDSRSDLVIEDVRIGGIANPAKNAKGQIVTENVTIGWKNTDPSSDGDKVDYHVFFSPESLRKTDGTSSMSIEWMDTRSAVADGDKLKDMPYSGFSFTMGGKVYKVTSDAIDAAKTYDQLVKAVKDAVAGVAGLENVTVSKGGNFSATDTETSIVKQGSKVILTATDGASMASGENITPTGTVPADSGLHTNIKFSATPGFITSKVVLDNVGRESEAGDLVIGSMSTRSGVEKFKVDVLRTEGKNVETMGNWVASMSSTNEKLQEVVIAKNDGAYLYVGSQDGSTAYESGVANNNLTVDREVPTFVNTDGLTDVRVFNASKMTGDVKVGATLANTDGADKSDTSKKYLLSKMDAATKAYYDEDSDGQVDFNYTTGSGKDTLNFDLEDNCDLNVTPGTGADKIQINIDKNLAGDIVIDLGKLTDGDGSADIVSFTGTFGSTLTVGAVVADGVEGSNDLAGDTVLDDAGTVQVTTATGEVVATIVGVESIDKIAINYAF